MSTKGIPVVAANIVAGDNAAVKVEVGSTVNVTIMNGASEKQISGELLAIELGNKPYYGARERAIYDGVKTSEYNNPVAAMIDNAADVMEVNAILIGVTGTEGEVTHERVPVGRIKSITAG